MKTQLLDGFGRWGFGAQTRPRAATPQASPVQEIPGLQRNWDFVQSAWRPFRITQRYYEMRFAEARPASSAVKELTPRELWAMYFIYSPTGTLEAHHRYTLDRL